VDTSNVGSGVMLLQADGGVEHPVIYFSRKFNSYQLIYSVGEKEALVLIWALKHRGMCVVPVVVYTDNNPLTFLHTMLCLKSRIMCWCLYLHACGCTTCKKCG
jgi:hypothetical protein